MLMSSIDFVPADFLTTIELDEIQFDKTLAEEPVRIPMLL
jgi:hypothetical protein